MLANRSLVRQDRPMLGTLNKFTLRDTFFPDHSQNLMKNEGDLEKARDFFFTFRPTNLHFLLEKRFAWMNTYIPAGATEVYELGSGAGFSKSFIANKNLKLTDISGKPWIDQHIDALNLPFADGSVDVFICSHMIHHLANPKQFFTQALKKLKPNGLIIISEIETSFITRLLLKAMRHEGWSYKVDVFSPTEVANDPHDAWSANCAIPELLFKNTARFEKEFAGVKVILNELTEFLVFPLSGGVIAKSPTLNLPRFLLHIVHFVDVILIKLAPSFFAMGRRVVLCKK